MSFFINKYSLLLNLILLYVISTCGVMAEDNVYFTAKEQKILMTFSPLDVSQIKNNGNRYANNKAAIAFGKKLFFDKRLSGNNEVSCASCHIPEKAFGNGDLELIRGIPTKRKTPALTNVGFNRWFNWDGSADSLWSQCFVPLENPEEMGSSRVEITRKILRENDLHTDYAKIFGKLPSALSLVNLPPKARPIPSDPSHHDHQLWLTMTNEQRQAVNQVFVNIGKAIGAFERRIISNNSPFDQFVSGIKSRDPKKLTAISPAAQRGAKLFIGKARCALCHSGPNFTDGEFHNVYSNEMGSADLGRWAGVNSVKKNPFNGLSKYSDLSEEKDTVWVKYVTRTVESKYQFKTPTLRNVALNTAFMHSNRFTTLEEVIDHYVDLDDVIAEDDHSETVLQSLDLTRKNKKDLVEFLKSLTDTEMVTRLVSK